MGRGGSGMGGGGGGFSGGGGGRGSSGMGGGRAGGGMMGGGPRGGGPRPPHRPIVHHWHFFGRPFIVTSGRSMAFIFCLFFLICSVFSTAVFASNYSDGREELEEIQEDSRVCTSMIADAAADGSLASYSTGYFYGTIRNYYSYSNTTGIYYYSTNDDGENIYYIRFSYTVGSRTYYSETFATYTYSEISEFIGSSSQSTISIVVWQDDDGDYDAINADYNESDNYNLISTEEYIKSNRNGLLISVAILVVIILIIVLVFVVTLKKSKKEEEKAKNKEKAETEAKQTQETAVHGRFCKYCGTQLDDDTRKCPNCGSTQIIKK